MEGLEPRVVTLVGRSNDKENQDLQGEYHRISAPALVHGRPAYRRPGARFVLRYWAPADRWLIDRNGLQETDSCAAYAEQGGAWHPAREDLVWRVWETDHQQHVRDTDLIATAAPPTVQVLGSAKSLACASLRGEYRLTGLYSGRVTYKKAGSSSTVIRYWPPDDRWLIDTRGLRESGECDAFAAAAAGPSMVAGLQWTLADPRLAQNSGRGVQSDVSAAGAPESSQSLDVVRDDEPLLMTVVAPAVVELSGREASKENVIMNGTYHLLGLHGGRPAYMKADGTRHAIRYWPKEDRWLVDFDGLQDRDICNAYAEAHGNSEHPADLGMVWSVWESSRGRHMLDRLVRALSSPHWVRISGRGADKENAAINGEYVLVGVVEGKAAYKKHGANHAIRYWPAEDRWIIDLERGFEGGDIANAYADAKGADNPGCPVLVWHVWHTVEGRHVVDNEVSSQALRYAPLELPKLMDLVGLSPGGQNASSNGSVAQGGG